MTYRSHDDLAALLFTRKNPDGARDAVSDLAVSAQRTLRVARSLAETGRPIDLYGLDRMVGLVTAQAIDLEPVDGRRLRPTLIGLLRDLDRLEYAVRGHQPSTAEDGPPPFN
jgi:hypothetical protein